MPKRDRVIWIDHGWQPLWIGFCPSEKAWDRQMRKMGSQMPYPEWNGGATIFRDTGEGSDCIIVTVGAAERRQPIEVVGILVHEATHVWQRVKEAMRERKPSREFEAYAMQAIAQELIHAYARTRGPLKVRA